MDNKGSISESKIVSELSRTLTERLGAGFSIQMDYGLFENERKTRYEVDIVILFNNEPFALLEVKNRRLSDSDFQAVLNRYSRVLYDNRIRFLILYDGKDYYLLDRANSDMLIHSSLSRIISVLKGKDYSDYPIPSYKQIIKKIISFIPNDFPNYFQMKYFISTLDEKDFVKDWDDIGKMVFADDEVEKRFISILLRTGCIDQVCRYTTLSSTFELIKGPKQNMCSIVCMNDRSENYYADSRVKYPITGTAQCNENNDTFIISCVDMGMSDKLTMWRLYGDDTKGCNLVYRVNNNGFPGFYLGRVSYEREDRSHPELKFIENLLNQKLNRGYRFKLRHWNIWKHFFKSYDFSIESEIRLVYFNSYSNNHIDAEIKWIENPKNKIVSKMALFSIEDSMSFPLILETIRLGPNVPEKDALIDQYDYMARQQLNYPVSIEPSNIKIYR